MRRADLTYTQKQRLNKQKVCPICKQPIYDTDEIKFTIVRYRRCKIYNFYHERCLINGTKKQKEETT